MVLRDNSAGVEWFFSQFGIEPPVHRDVTEEVKVWLALGAALLALCYHLWQRFLKPREDAVALWSLRGLNGTLVLLCVASFCNYSRYEFEHVWKNRVDSYDLVHYYLNAKYFDELGYFELYPAVLLAHVEEGLVDNRPLPPQVQFQNEEDYYFVNTQQFIGDNEEHNRIRSLFGDHARWTQFQGDFVHLQRNVTGFTRQTWVQMLNDHGFNGAPSWLLIAHPLANAVPVEHVKVLGYLDVAWLLAAVGLVWWAFGFRGAGFTFLFLLTTYSTRWPTITWAFGRYDYVSALIIAVCFLKKSKHWWAGGFAAIAAALRVFPAVWLWGPGFKGVYELVRYRRVNRRLLGLAGAFVLVHQALWGGVVAKWGPEPIETHFHNMFAHTTEDNLSSMRQGFALAAAYTPAEAAEGFRFVAGGPEPSHNNRMNQDRRERVKDQKNVRTGIALVLVLALGWAYRRKPDHESFAMGVVPFFLLATASYYYYVIRATLIPTHADDLGKGRHAFGLVWLFLIEAAINWVQGAHERWRVIHIGWMGWMLTIYCVVMVVWALLEDRREGPTEAPS